ncbi:AraC family transcriptional regulator [Streptomyces niveus]|uniref:AraC family transcriptional regulator n=1 Tax=Streptomyces niveus TaxID=193462 RepID=A0ABZ1ZYY2_STRNV|nr:AraC family transcriptional regulator [Streptomyces niveus]
MRNCSDSHTGDDVPGRTSDEAKETAVERPYLQWMHYLTPGPTHRRLGLTCLGVGHQDGLLPTVGPRTLPHHVVVVVTQGTGWFRTADGATIDVVAPAVLWLRPDVVHHYGVNDPGWTEWFIDFTGQAAEAYETLGFIETDTPVSALTNAEPAVRAIGRVAQACRRGSPYLETEASALVHEVLLALRGERADESSKHGSMLSGLARNACLSLSIAEHAKHLGVSVAELRELVRRLAGSTPKDYVMTIRLGRAKDLLATTDLPVSSIARRVGYDDPAYFTRVFNRRVGLSPSGFREQHHRGFLTQDNAQDDAADNGEDNAAE